MKAMKNNKSPAAKRGGVVKSIRLTPMKRSMKLAKVQIETFETKCPHIVVSIGSRKADPNVAAFIKPMSDHFVADIEAGSTNVSEEWGICMFVPLRAAGSPNVAKKVANDSNYIWEGMVSIKTDENASTRAIGENIAAKFSQYSTESYQKQKFEFKGVAGGEEAKAVNAYLLDHDATTLLRMIYAEASKEELEGDGEILKAFYGSEGYGKKVLESYSEVAWAGLLDQAE